MAKNIRGPITSADAHEALIALERALEGFITATEAIPELYVLLEESMENVNYAIDLIEDAVENNFLVTYTDNVIDIRDFQKV